MKRTLLILALCCTSLAIVAPVAGAAPSKPDVTERRVSFSVVNDNDTASQGATDHQPYTIKGHMVGPRSAFRAARRGEQPLSPTLYLHGLSYSSFFWHLREFPEYDYAARMADRGHVSVVIDRLGYGQSGKPEGMLDSYGGQATVVNQITEDLRSGTYRFGSSRSKPEPPVDRLALAGHSASVFIAQIAAYTFDNVDALLLMSLGDLGASPTAVLGFAATQSVCSSGGRAADNGRGPGGYARFGQTEADFRAFHLFNVEPRVADRATRLRTLDPCGESGTALQAIATDVLSTNTIDEPVLLLYGENDALFPPPQSSVTQSLLYAGNDDVTLEIVPNTPHAVTLARTAPDVRERISAWLKDRGF
ncbi:MAG: alpha/beta hydrolase [Thermoleophilaceae bacterium]|nr:alpha/beta hydrolase [Thermoleophilaceae bacterium]